MTVTLEQVTIALSPCEPDLMRTAQRLGVGAIPYLAELVRGTDIMLAARAALLAGYLDAPGSAEIVETAAHHPESAVRVAAAAALESLTLYTDALALSLLADEYPGVRKWALRSVKATGSSVLKERVQSIAESDPEEFLQDMAKGMARAF